MELYNTNQAANGRDQFGVGNKFITPMIINGKVYVGTTTGVGVFGLLSDGAEKLKTSGTETNGSAASSVVIPQGK